MKKKKNGDDDGDELLLAAAAPSTKTVLCVCRPCNYYYNYYDETFLRYIKNLFSISVLSVSVRYLFENNNNNEEEQEEDIVPNYC